MLGDDRPAQRVWIGPEWRDDPRQGDWRGYFDDVVDVICPDAQSRGPRYGYGAGPRADAEARDGVRHAARHGKGRRIAGNRNGVAALTAAAVVGTGVSAGVLGVVPFMTPTTTSPGVTSSVHAPAAAAAPGSGAAAQHHTGYVGKHRQAAAAPSSAPAHLGTQTGTSPAGSAPSSGLSYAPTSSSSAAGTATASHQGGTSSSASTSTAARTTPPPSSSPAPKGGTGTTTSTSSGTPAGTGTTSGGSTSSPSTSSGGGLVGGLVGGVTGLVGGLLG
jgi:hypothetical protein